MNAILPSASSLRPGELIQGVNLRRPVATSWRGKFACAELGSWLHAFCCVVQRLRLDLSNWGAGTLQPQIWELFFACDPRACAAET